MQTLCCKKSHLLAYWLRKKTKHYSFIFKETVLNDFSVNFNISINNMLFIKYYSFKNKFTILSKSLSEEGR